MMRRGYRKVAAHGPHESNQFPDLHENDPLSYNILGQCPEYLRVTRSRISKLSRGGATVSLDKPTGTCVGRNLHDRGRFVRFCYNPVRNLNVVVNQKGGQQYWRTEAIGIGGCPPTRRARRTGRCEKIRVKRAESTQAVKVKICENQIED